MNIYRRRHGPYRALAAGGLHSRGAGQKGRRDISDFTLAGGASRKPKKSSCGQQHLNRASNNVWRSWAWVHWWWHRERLHVLGQKDAKRPVKLYNRHHRETNHSNHTFCLTESSRKPPHRIGFQGRRSRQIVQTTPGQSGHIITYPVISCQQIVNLQCRLSPNSDATESLSSAGFG